MRSTDLSPKLQRLLKTSRYAVIATVCPDGRPWNTPVAAAFDDGLNLYWGSAAASRHSRNISADKRIFAVVFGGAGSEAEGQGIYLQMQAAPISTAAGVRKALTHYDASFFEKYHPGITFLGDCPTRLYKAVPLEVWFNRDTVQDGYFIDIRESIRKHC